MTHPRACRTCGRACPPERRKYCSNRCMYARPTKTREPYALRRERAERNAETRYCACGSPFRYVKKLREKFCSTRCSAVYAVRPTRGSTQTRKCEWRCEVPWRNCEYCGAAFISRYKQSKFCSRACRPNWRSTPPRTRTCRVCGDSFTRQGRGAGSRTCSKKCRERLRKTSPAEIARRRVKRAEREAFIAAGEKFANWEIFVRDNWICHICGKHIPRKKWPHPLSPTIDHLIPVNGPEKGAHTRLNVRAAHFKCNYERREVGPAQLILFGEIAA